MSFYQLVYINLCKRGRELKEQYKPRSGLHAHHIIPKHSGGNDNENNITYLTPREHKIAHFLLWKMHNNPDDLRSMYMLGAELSVKKRRIIGEYCRDNSLGFFGATKEVRDQGRRKAAKKAYDSKKGIHDPIKKSLYASLGGRASWNSSNNVSFKYWASPEGRKHRSKLGAAKSAKFPITDGRVTKKLKTEEDRKVFLQANPSWRAGTHHVSPLKGKSINRPSPHRKTVIVDNDIFESIFHAAQHFNVSSATVINRCKSEKPAWINWKFSS